MPKRRWTNEDFAEAVRTSSSLYQVAEKLGNKKNGSHKMVKSYIQKLNLDISHFRKAYETLAYARTFQRKRTLEELLVKDGQYSDSKKIRERFIREKTIPYECSICKISTWLDKPLSLQLDHQNGDHCDNRLENLRWLCANCHSQTDNYCGRKNRKSEPVIRSARVPTKPKEKKPRPNKISWPDQAFLMSLVTYFGYSRTGRVLGVSDNAVRKRLVGPSGNDPETCRLRGECSTD